MIYEILALILLTLLSEIKCSVVLDAIGQKGLHVSNYCPKMTYCPEGAHVMCMYHNPNHKYGPRCNMPRDIETTPELAKLFLHRANKLRAEIALGNARGKGQVFLPRGYGIFKLKWDEELATLAQLLANQCMLKHDLCRSTSRFPDPGQTVGMCRLSHPDWFIVKPRKFQFSTPGLSTEKLIYAINQSALGWAGQKVYVTPDMIRNYPDWTLNPEDRGGKLYMDIISGDARYMGCGISAFNDLASRDGQTSLFNSILVICNFSARGRKGSPLFKTVRPATPEFTPACGCPVGESVEDNDCLCVEKEPASLEPSKSPARTCSDDDMNCEPTIVLLPIFTVEDAPPQKLIGRDRSTLLGSRNSSVDVIDMFDNVDNINNNIFGDLNYRQKTLKPIVIQSRQHPNTLSPATSTHKKILDVRNRHFNKPILSKNRFSLKQTLRTPMKNSQMNRKSRSIFSRGQKFQLPRNRIGNTINDIKKDVVPRKDFSRVQKLVDVYLNSKRINEPLKTDLIQKQHREGHDIDAFLMRKHANEFEEHTEVVLNTAKDRLLNFNQYLRNITTEEPSHVEFKNFNEDSDNKLMTLLNTLEQEVKHIQLHGDEKELFDAKLRKIYGSVVGKPDNSLNHKHNKENFDFLEHEVPNYNKHKANYLAVGDVLDRKVDPRYDDDRIKGFGTDLRLIDNNDHREISKSYDKIHSKYDGPTNIGRSYKFRELSSDEEFRPRNYDRYTYDGVKNRKTYSESGRGLYRHRYLDEMKMSNRAGERMKSKNYYGNDLNDDPLMSIERRKYYQEKLDNLDKRVHNTRSYKRLRRTEPENDHHLRAMRPSRDDLHGRSKNQIDPYYMPERATFLHGF